MKPVWDLLATKEGSHCRCTKSMVAAVQCHADSGNAFRGRQCANGNGWQCRGIGRLFQFVIAEGVILGGFIAKISVVVEVMDF